MQPEPSSKVARPRSALTLWGQPVRLWPVLVGLGIVLFPFDWLSDVWTPFGRLFDQVFVSEVQHAIGHTIMFLLLGLLALLTITALQRRWAYYQWLMLLVGVAQEALQDLSRRLPPNIYEVRDLFFDVTGAALAFLLVWAWQRLWSRRKPQPKSLEEA